MLYKLFDKMAVFSSFFRINFGHVKVCVWWRREREREGGDGEGGKTEREREERVCLMWKWNGSYESRLRSGKR